MMGMFPSLTPGTVFLSRHGESVNNLYGRIGGDAGLTEMGQKYAVRLGEFFSSRSLPDMEVREQNPPNGVTIFFYFQ